MGNLIMTADRALIRHTLAVLAYRAAKPLRDAPDTFATFKSSETTRTPVQILAHMGDLLDWALSSVSGAETWHNSTPLPWAEERARFFAALERLDAYLGSDAVAATPFEKLFQGPIADALTHVGQLTMLRRQHGAPIRGENYYAAKITTGRTGADQPAPVREFD
jgi:hypothetical protein